MSEFTEEEAADKLKELGFEVLLKDDLVLLGWQIIYRPEWDNWAVHQVDCRKDDETRKPLYMTLFVADDPRECHTWLKAEMTKEGWAW
jgi:hypothetical protein